MRQEEWIFVGFMVFICVSITALLIGNWSYMSYSVRIVAISSCAFCYFAGYMMIKDMWK